MTPETAKVKKRFLLQLRLALALAAVSSIVAIAALWSAHSLRRDLRHGRGDIQVRSIRTDALTMRGPDGKPRVLLDATDDEPTLFFYGEMLVDALQAQDIQIMTEDGKSVVWLTSFGDEAMASIRGGAFVGGLSTHDFSVTNDAAQPLIRMGSTRGGDPLLTLHDQDRSTRLSMGLTRGSPHIALLDGYGDERMTLMADSRTDLTALAMLCPDGHNRLLMAIHPNRTAVIGLMDPSGHTKIGMSVDQTGRADREGLR